MKSPSFEKQTFSKELTGSKLDNRALLAIGRGYLKEHNLPAALRCLQEAVKLKIKSLLL